MGHKGQRSRSHSSKVSVCLLCFSSTTLHCHLLHILYIMSRNVHFLIFYNLKKSASKKNLDGYSCKATREQQTMNCACSGECDLVGDVMFSQ